MPCESRRFFAVPLFVIAALTLFPFGAFAQSNSPTISVNAQDLIPRATVFISPPTETILEGSTFNVSVYLNTEGNSANTLDLTVQFPPDKLAIVSPSGGTSLIQLWLQPPTYSNENGTAEFTGVIPNGVVTQSGLITTITFKAIAPGEADVTLSPDSSVLANDGFGTQMNTEFGRATYTISPQPPGGVNVFSPTQPFQSEWYNNNNAELQWNQDPGVTAFSYVLDNQPNTVPGDVANTTRTSASFQSLGDGLWYFHIKAQKYGVWGVPTNFLLQIDTQPPAAFTPIAEVIPGNPQNKILISFSTTDALSGIDHYEVATIDKNAPAVVSPVFIQAQSPYQLSVVGSGSYHVIVRAFDRAGNVRDESIDVNVSTPFGEFIEQNYLIFIIGLLLLIVLLFVLHYFYGHKIFDRVHNAILAAELEDRKARLADAERLIHEEQKKTNAVLSPSEPAHNPEQPKEDDQAH